MATMEVAVHLPRPHAKQAAVKLSQAKRLCVVAGRRSGKTTLAAMLAVEKALAGRRVLEAAPTTEQTTAFWTACKKALAAPVQVGLIRKNETERLLEFPGGARIRAKTAWNADMLRGDYADFLVLDEYSLMHPNTWNEVGAPMLLDNNGDALFIFTPKRRNHAHVHFVRALGDTTGRWAAWHFTSYDNPYLSAAALAEITFDMTEDAYQQEIMAEFLENEGAVFRNIPACLVLASSIEPEMHQGHRIVAGVDWAKSVDFTTISVFCTTCHQELALDRFNQVDYILQRERIKIICERWKLAGLLVELNSIGEPNFEQLQRDGLPVHGFTMTMTSKPPLIESLVLAFEREEAQWLDIPVATAELEAYERRVNPTTNRSQYGAPEGVHDDTVIARALAWHGAQNRYASAGLLESVNPRSTSRLTVLRDSPAGGRWEREKATGYRKR